MSLPAITPDVFRRAFHLLGERLAVPARLVLAGGSALLLGGHLPRRTTGDGDAIVCDPSFDDAIRAAVAAVGRELAIATTWVNDGASTFAHFLAPDYPTRCVPYLDTRRLRVDLLGRQDLILLKLMALRTADMEDLDSLAPTADELAFATGQFVRIAALDAARVRRARFYLEGGGVRPSEYRLSDPAPRRRHRPGGTGNP